MVVVTVKRYQYTVASEEDKGDVNAESAVLLRGFTFAVKEHEELNELMQRALAKFEVDGSSSESKVDLSNWWLISEEDGSVIEKVEQINDRDTLELYYFSSSLDENIQSELKQIGEDETVTGDAVDSSAVSSELPAEPAGLGSPQISDGAIPRKEFDLGIFPNYSKIKDNIPRLGKKKLKITDFVGPFSVKIQKDKNFAKITDSNKTHIIVFKQILPLDLLADSTSSLPDDFFTTVVQKVNWIIILCHGGKFAGAVFKDGKKIDHKTFSRYVQRKKQGKRQINYDKKGAAAGSAGSYMRRFHETKLQEEITDLVVSWKHHFDSADRIFLFTPGNNKYSIFFDNSPIRQDDPRIKSVPVSTRTANMVEVDHVLFSLTTAKISLLESSLESKVEQKVKS
jgi:hypothetical protein